MGPPYLPITWILLVWTVLTIYWDSALKREYDIKVEPNVSPVQHVRMNVPIESKVAIGEAIDYTVQQNILEPQIELTSWVSPVTGQVNKSKALMWYEESQQSHHPWEP